MSDLCYICRKEKRTSEPLRDPVPVTVRVTCRRCGSYDMAHKFIAGERNASDFLTDGERRRLSHAIRKATDADRSFAELGVLNYDSIKQVAAQHPLPDPVEQADLLIESIAQRAEYGDKTPNEHGEVWAARVGMRDAAQLGALQQELSNLVAMSALQGGDMLFWLTFEGWKRARELRKQRGPGNQAFVAMWFHADMDAAFDEGFAAAIQATGHTAYRVDRDAHNNKIDDQIVAQIRRSKLVIVDATGARPNAYWEAGFARGLDIPVIWCCSDNPTAPGLSTGNWTDNLPFDVRQHAFTFWSNPTDLKDKLTARIRALGFDTAWNHGQR